MYKLFIDTFRLNHIYIREYYWINASQISCTDVLLFIGSIIIMTMIRMLNKYI